MDTTRLLKILGKKKKAPAPAQPKEYVNTAVVTCPHCDFEHPEAPPQNMAIGCGNCGKPFEVQVIRTATGKRVHLPAQTHDHAEYIKTFTTNPVKVMEKKAPADIATVEEAVAHYRAGLLSAEDFKRMALHKGWVFWNLNEDRNPFSPEGDNKARERGAIYNPSKHPKGIIFQHVIKESIRNFMDFGYGATRVLYGKDKDKAGWFKRWMVRRMLSLAPKTIDMANSMMKTQYDKDAFVFDNPFLIALHDLAHEHISANFQWDYPWLDERMRKGTDMTLAILKEDMPYRAKAKLFINDLIKRYPNGFPLTEAEQECHELSLKEGERCHRGEKFKGIKPSFIK